MNIIERPVCNFWEGRNGIKFPTDICLHITDGLPGVPLNIESVFNTFNNPATGASTHYCIDKNGDIQHYVDDLNTAWGCGVAPNHQVPSNPLQKRYPGQNENFHCINIEVLARQGEQLTPEQKTALIELLNSVCMNNGIPKTREHILGHYELDTQRAQDPISVYSVDDVVKWINAPVAPVILPLPAIIPPYVPYADQDKIPEWAVQAVKNMKQQKIMIGDTDNTFRPNDPITRAEFAAALDRNNTNIK